MTIDWNVKCRTEFSSDFLNQFVFKCQCFLKVISLYLSGKTKYLMKQDKLMKKKFPDYKVAYVTLVCTVLVYMHLRYSCANVSYSPFWKCLVVTSRCSFSLLYSSSLGVFCLIHCKPTNPNVCLVMEIWNLTLVTSLLALHTITRHTFHLELCCSSAFVFSHRNVTIPSPGYRYLQVSRFISKSRRKRPGNCPETERNHSRRTRAASLVLKARGTSRTHSWGIISVLGQPWIALILRERNSDRHASKRRPSLCSVILDRKKLDYRWTLVSGVWGWSLTTKTADKEKRNIFCTATFSSYAYKDYKVF